MALVERHIAFVEALRRAGLPVSLAEDLDAVRAVLSVGLTDRETVKAGMAATLVKRHGHRETFDAIFDLFFPALLGSGADWSHLPADWSDLSRDLSDLPADLSDLPAELSHLSPQDLENFRDAVVEALAAGDGDRAQQLAVGAVGQFGSMPGRAPGMSAWSSYNTLQKLSPDLLVSRLARALREGINDTERRSDELAMLTATHRVDDFRRRVESDVRRRLAEDKGADYVAETTLRPSLDQISFTAARASEVEQMRREIYPLARRLASRLTQEQHHRRRGPLDFRRTVRASISTGGVPLATYHKPKRPHRPELVVLCDVSGSVASFAQFTLLLVYALREQFGKVRAFTLVDDIHEVTDDFVPGADPAETMTRLAASARKASLWGRTNYGRSLNRFQEQYADALGPKSTLLILGDARSNYSDPGLDALREMVGAARQAWWLNPEHPRQWGSGDSAAPDYLRVVPMVECRNLTQLTEFVHDLL